MAAWSPILTTPLKVDLDFNGKNLYDAAYIYTDVIAGANLNLQLSSAPAATSGPGNNIILSGGVNNGSGIDGAIFVGSNITDDIQIGMATIDSLRISGDIYIGGGLNRAVGGVYAISGETYVLNETYFNKGRIILNTPESALDHPFDNYETQLVATPATLEDAITTLPDFTGTILLDSKFFPIKHPGSTSDIGDATLAGSGLDDLTTGGTYTGKHRAEYKATISTASDPDKFVWAKDGGDVSAEIVISGGAQALNDGVTITFGADTGHTLDDDWTFSAGYDEMNLVLTNPTAERTITFPDSTGTVALLEGVSQSFTGAISVQSLIVSDTGGYDSGNISIIGSGGGKIRFEGVTANANHTDLVVSDPSGTHLITMPDDSGTVALTGTVVTQNFAGAVNADTVSVGTGGEDSVASITLLAGGIKAEGTTADSYEILIAFKDASVDRLLYVPDDTGTFAVISSNSVTQDFTSDIGCDNLLAREGWEYSGGDAPSTFELANPPSGLDTDASGGYDDDGTITDVITSGIGEVDDNIVVDVTIANGLITSIVQANPGGPTGSGKVDGILVLTGLPAAIIAQVNAGTSCVGNGSVTITAVYTTTIIGETPTRDITLTVPDIGDEDAGGQIAANYLLSRGNQSIYGETTFYGDFIFAGSDFTMQQASDIKSIDNLKIIVDKLNGNAQLNIECAASNGIATITLDTDGQGGSGVSGNCITDNPVLTGVTAAHTRLASEYAIKSYVDSISTNQRYFTLTQQYYNCCSLDGRFYYRDTDSQNSGNNIGYLKWVSQDIEDPTAIGDTVSLRAPFAKASGFGQIVPVDCEFLKVNMSWGNASAYEVGQGMYTMTCTPPDDANADGNWLVTTRDIWLITGPGCDESVFGHSTQLICEAATNHSGLGPQDEHWAEGTYDTVNACAFQYDQDIPTTGSGYTWDRELAAGDHVGLGIYSHQTHLGQPSVTGSVTWWFRTI